MCDENKKSIPYVDRMLNIATEVVTGNIGEDIHDIVKKLTDDAIMIDDTDPSFHSSMAMKFWNDSCEKHLRDHGYSGGPLKTAQESYSEIGDLFVLFDEDEYTATEAIEYLNKHVRNNPDLAG